MRAPVNATHAHTGSVRSPRRLSDDRPAGRTPARQSPRSTTILPESRDASGKAPNRCRAGPLREWMSRPCPEEPLSRLHCSHREQWTRWQIRTGAVVPAPASNNPALKQRQERPLDEATRNATRTRNSGNPYGSSRIPVARARPQASPRSQGGPCCRTGNSEIAPQPHGALRVEAGIYAVHADIRRRLFGVGFAAPVTNAVARLFRAAS